MYKFDYSNSQKTLFSAPLSILFLFFAVFSGYLASSFMAVLVVFLPYSNFQVHQMTDLMQNTSLLYQEPTLLIGIQGVFMLVSFVVFPILLLHLVEKREFGDLWHPSAKLEKQIKMLIPCVFIMVLAYPISLKTRELTINLIDSGFFGQFGKLMQSQEKEQELMISSMLNVKNIQETILLFLVVGLLPAVGEEIVFRGLLQNHLIKWGIKSWFSILITGFIFSAVHFSLTDFVPRFLLGSALGLTYYLTKNFLVPVILHCLNNSLSLLYYIGLEKQKVSTNIEEPGSISWAVAWLSVGLLVFVIWYLIQISKLYYSNKSIEPYKDNH
jgi:uncharacterized protein